MRNNSMRAGKNQEDCNPEAKSVKNRKEEQGLILQMSSKMDLKKVQWIRQKEEGLLVTVDRAGAEEVEVGEISPWVEELREDKEWK